MISVIPLMSVISMVAVMTPAVAVPVAAISIHALPVAALRPGPLLPAVGRPISLAPPIPGLSGSTAVAIE
jgi:hypothetical protein